MTQEAEKIPKKLLHELSEYTQDGFWLFYKDSNGEFDQIIEIETMSACLSFQKYIELFLENAHENQLSSMPKARSCIVIGEVDNDNDNDDEETD